MLDRNLVMAILKAELAFVQRGGYRRGPRYPWRPNFVFEDSPTCLNYQDKEERQPCAACPPDRVCARGTARRTVPVPPYSPDGPRRDREHVL
jgi:hypothetical protein